MSINHNRIKVADLEKNLPNKILITNSDGELEFTETYNFLDCITEGKVLDARQGKELKDLIDNIKSTGSSSCTSIIPKNGMIVFKRGETTPKALEVTDVVQTIIGNLKVEGIYLGGDNQSIESYYVLESKDLTSIITIWDGENWSNGEPTEEMVAIINGPLDTSIQNNLVCYYLYNNSDVIITTSKFLRAKKIKNNGNILVEDNGNLFQHGSDSFYKGNSIIIKSKTNPVFRYDYTYWASPVTGQTMKQTSTTTLYDRYFWYNHLTGWVTNISGTMIMEAGRGYLIRAPQTYPIEGGSNTPLVFEATFNGVPNTGEYEINLPDVEKSYFLGNPYPSYFSWDLFYMENKNVIYSENSVWVPKTPISNELGGASYVPNYETYNLLGGIGANDVKPRPNGLMEIARGFFVKNKTVGNVVFKDNMRIETTNPLNIIRSRFWLNLKNEAGNSFSELLIGYIEGYDDYDFSTYTSQQSQMHIGTIYDSNYSFSGKSRKTQFDINDRETIRIKILVAGNYNIKLADFDGLFENQNIFLIDKLLDVVINLKTTIHNFISEVGTFDDRFEIVYLLQESVDIDAEKFINAVGTLTESQKNAVNNLVVGFKNNGTWNKYHVIYIFIGGTAESHKWNLKDPRDLDEAFRLNYVAGINHSFEGMHGSANHDHAHAETFYIPINHLELNNCHIGYFSKSTGSTGVDIGCYSNSNFFIQKNWYHGSNVEDAKAFLGLNSDYVEITNLDDFEHTIINRTTSENYKLFTNGIFNQTINSVSTVLPDVSIWVNGFNNISGIEHSNRVTSFVTIGLSLTETEILADYNLIEAYQTALGR